jgi:hypothetical protein
VHTGTMATILMLARRTDTTVLAGLRVVYSSEPAPGITAGMDAVGGLAGTVAAGMAAGGTVAPDTAIVVVTAIAVATAAVMLTAAELPALRSVVAASEAALAEAGSTAAVDVGK